MLIRRFTMICLVCMVFGIGFAKLVSQKHSLGTSAHAQIERSYCRGNVQHWTCPDMNWKR